MTVEQLLRLSERMCLEATAWRVLGCIKTDRGRAVYDELWDLHDYLNLLALQQCCAPFTVASGLRNV